MGNILKIQRRSTTDLFHWQKIKFIRNKFKRAEMMQFSSVLLDLLIRFQNWSYYYISTDLISANSNKQLKFALIYKKKNLNLVVGRSSAKELMIGAIDEENGTRSLALWPTTQSNQTKRKRKLFDRSRNQMQRDSNNRIEKREVERETNRSLRREDNEKAQNDGNAKLHRREKREIWWFHFSWRALLFSLA